MKNNIQQNPIHLGLGATAVVEPQFNGKMEWYAEYGGRHASDGAEGRLVNLHTFTESWNEWEVHPNGSEVVLCVAGSICLLYTSPSPRDRTRSRMPSSA